MGKNDEPNPSKQEIDKCLRRLRFQMRRSEIWELGRMMVAEPPVQEGDGERDSHYEELAEHRGWRWLSHRTQDKKLPQK